MAVIAKETVINAAPQRVFEYVSDLRKHPEWAQHGLEVTQTSQGPIQGGATFSSVAHQFGTQRETQTITEFQPNSRVTFEATGSLGVARHTFALTPEGAGTHVTKSMELIRPSLLARVMGPMIASQQHKALAVDLERIKTNLERQS